VLTDLFGSTPSNIANRLLDRHHVNIVSGVNAPMLLRIMNYPDTDLDSLGEIAVTGARSGIVITSRKQAS
jgi:PTS system mannose-specific IIA component